MFTGDRLYMLFMHQACVYKTKQQYVKSNEILTAVVKEALLNCRINDTLKDAIQAFQVKMNVKQEYLVYYVQKHIHNCYDNPLIVTSSTGAKHQLSTIPAGL
jgi:hypothetical protein